MPLNAGGKLTIVASSDLGALGSRDGSPIDYNWVLPGIAPLLLPWLAILGLLILKPNRCAGAWLIWLPLGCVLAFILVPLPIRPAGTDFLLDVIAALAVGLAAVWLLSNYLRQQHRLLTFLCLLLALAGFSVLAFVSRQGLSLLTIESLQVGIVLAVGVLASSVALSLGGLICRGRYRPLGLYLWLFLSLTAIWLVMVAPFFLIALIVSGGRIAWSGFFVPVLVAAMVNFATLLPFLILSLVSPFFRERLKALLHVKPEVPPPLNMPLPDAQLKT
ncbi:MAG: hypothetical protein ABSC89_16885 [Verrucomicrobiota bacterium]